MAATGANSLRNQLPRTTTSVGPLFHSFHARNWTNSQRASKGIGLYVVSHVTQNRAYTSFSSTPVIINSFFSFLILITNFQIYISLISNKFKHPSTKTQTITTQKSTLLKEKHNILSLKLNHPSSDDYERRKIGTVPFSIPIKTQRG